MDWVAVSVDVNDDPKIAAFATALGIELDSAVARLVSLWGRMARQKIEDGNVAAVPDELLEQWAHWRGKTGRFAQEFRARFTTNGVVNGWMKWNGRAMAKARKGREEAQAMRDQAAAEIGHTPGPGARFLYAIQRPIDGAIKVGISRSPRRRVEDLQQASGQTFTLLGYAPGTFTHERQAHRDLAEYNVGGEWFADHPVVRQWVSQLITAGTPGRTAGAASGLAAGHADGWPTETGTKTKTGTGTIPGKAAAAAAREVDPAEADAVAGELPEPYRAAFRELLLAAARPRALLAELRALHAGVPGHGRGYGWDVIGHALHDLALAGAPISARAIRAFCEDLVTGKSAAAQAGTQDETEADAALRRHRAKAGQPA